MKKTTQKISLTSLFERIIRLEEKVDQLSQRGERSTKRFTYWAIVITALEVLNLWVHSLSVWGH